MGKQANEKIGLIPRSIIRTLDRFSKQLRPETKNLAMQEFRVSRQQMRVSISCFLTLFLVPLGVNILSKQVLIEPLTEYFWNSLQEQVFLNSYQSRRAVYEMQDFKDIFLFESLLVNNSTILSNSNLTSFNDSEFMAVQDSQSLLRKPDFLSTNNITKIQLAPELEDTHIFSLESQLKNLNSSSAGMQSSLQKKIKQLAKTYNQQSIQAITNLIGDLITLATIQFLFVSMKPQIFILKSFLTESLYSLSDTNKSFLLILITDLLVGYHSPKGWEVLTEIALQHYGFPETRTFILVFIGTFPVFVDTIFKYWIFRHLNRISPSTVVTYHSMIE
jgi:hypothetical protein